MEFVPICLQCKNFKKNDYCTVFKKAPPFEIKNREIYCKYFTGGKYTTSNELKRGTKNV